MALEIPRDIEKTLPPRVRTDLAAFSSKQQQTFVDLYKKRERNKTIMIILSIFFPIQMFFLGKVGLGIIFWLTLGGLGIWWFVEIFLTAGRTDSYNSNMAEEILADIKVS